MNTNYWPKGYEEDFNGLDISKLKEAINQLKGETLLEIGCGNGRWTNELLVPKFEVTAIDIIEKPVYGGFKYHKVTECNLKLFADRSFDCVYSHGVFCHLPLECQISYLKEVKRVMRNNGLIMLANWGRHQALMNRTDEFLDGWFYNDLKQTGEMFSDVGLRWVDFDPTYRDTLAIIYE
jgi:cyclopropane fatty-acyl-phospholipid synthase-like methyltransferase